MSNDAQYIYYRLGSEDESGTAWSNQAPITDGISQLAFSHVFPGGSYGWYYECDYTNIDYSYQAFDFSNSGSSYHAYLSGSTWLEYLVSPFRGVLGSNDGFVYDPATKTVKTSDGRTLYDPFGNKVYGTDIILSSASGVYIAS